MCVGWDRQPEANTYVPATLVKTSDEILEIFEIIELKKVKSEHFQGLSQFTSQFRSSVHTEGSFKLFLVLKETGVMEVRYRLSLLVYNVKQCLA